MSLTQAKCTNCGASIEVDPQTEAGICPYCKTAYITQKAIVNYNTTIVNNNTIQAETVNILGGDFNNLMQIAKECWNGKDYEGAFQKFTQALEIDPDSEEAALYRGLCLGWKERETNYTILLNTYHRVFDKVDYSAAGKEQVEMLDTFLRELEALNFATVNFKYKQYNPDLYDTTDNIQYVWQGIETGITVQRDILKFSDKIKDKSEGCKNAHVGYMKRLLNYYQTICIKWKYLMPIDHRYHSSVYHPKRDYFQNQIELLIEEIKKYQPDFTCKAVKKGGSVQKNFICACVLTAVAFVLELVLRFTPFYSIVPVIILDAVLLGAGVAALVINIRILIRSKTLDKKIMIVTIVLLVICAYLSITSLISFIQYIRFL